MKRASGHSCLKLLEKAKSCASFATDAGMCVRRSTARLQPYVYATKAYIGLSGIKHRRLAVTQGLLGWIPNSASRACSFPEQVNRTYHESCEGHRPFLYSLDCRKLKHAAPGRDLAGTRAYQHHSQLLSSLE